MPVSVPTNEEFQALAGRVTKLEQQGPQPGGPTQDGIYTSIPGVKITDDAGNRYEITSAAQIAKNAVVDNITKNVVMIGMSKRKCVQKNSDNNWYQDNNNTQLTNSTQWQQIQDPNQSGGGGGVTGFHVSGGQLLDVNNQRVNRRGINICYRRVWGDKGVDLYRVPRAQLEASFPGIGIIRLACVYDSPGPDVGDQETINWVNDMTSHNIVVEMDLHYMQHAVPPNDAGSNNWLHGWGNIFKDNEMVWFGTQNEPHGSGKEISSMMKGQYDAVRSSGNNNIVILCCGNPGGEMSDMDQNDFNGMTKVVFDAHSYGWMYSQAGYSTFSGMISQNLGKFRSHDDANHSIPTLCLEYGDGATSDGQDGNWQQVINEANTAQVTAAWMSNWMTSPADCFWNAPYDGKSLTSYGNVIKGKIGGG